MGKNENQNKFEVVSISNLLDKSFNIPFYQRGYRWEKQQVEDLLNDLAEFVDIDKLKNDEFYCLQPIVVKKNPNLTKGEEVYDIIDGQQRLTTIYLDNKFTSKIKTNSTEQSYKDYFEQSIEHEWTDMLWNDVYVSWKKNNNKEEQPYPVIDDKFLNLYKYLLKMVYFAKTGKVKFTEPDGKESERDVVVDDFRYDSNDIKKNILSDKNNIEFIFNAIDLFYAIQDTEKFFNYLFYYSNDEPIIINDNSLKVRLFGIDTVNLFKLCIEGDDNKFDVKSQIMLYCIIKYCLRFKCVKINVQLRDYVRVCRNLIESINQRLAKDVVIRPNVRLNDMAKYDASINKLIEKEDVNESLESLKNEKEFAFGKIENEIKKSKIKSKEKKYLRNVENFSFIRGNVAIFNDNNKFESIYKAIVSFNGYNTDVERIRALVALGFKGESFGSCRHGVRTFFGTKYRWDIIFMSTNVDTKNAVNEYIERIVKGSDYQEIINSASQNNSGKFDFKYYMCRYDDFISAYTSGNDPYYYFSINGAVDDLDIISLGTYGQNPLVAYHTEPFAFAVAESFKDFTEIYKNFTTSSIYSDKAKLLIKDKNIGLSIKKDHWEIVQINDEMVQIDNQIVKKFCIRDNCLNMEKDKDLIETAVDFIKQLYGLNSCK